jgi:hypothetical protein
MPSMRRRRLDALGPNRLCELLEQEGIAVGHGLASRRERHVRVAPEPPRQHPCGAVGAEGTRPDDDNRRVGQEASDGIADTGRAGGHHHCRPEAPESNREEPQERHGLLVAPMGIIDDQ